MPVPPRAERRRLEDELRSRGLPLVLSPAIRGRALIERTAPVMLGLATLLTGLDLGERIGDELPDPETWEPGTTPEDLALVGLMLAALGLLLASPFVAWLTTFVERRLPRRARVVLGLVAIGVLLAGPLIIGLPVLPYLPLRVLAAAGVLLLAYWGVGTMLTWAGHRAVHELWTLGPMISRVLPVLMVAVLFFFYNAEIWQIVATLSFGRTWAAVAVFLGLAVVLTAVNASDEVGELLRDQRQRHRTSRLRPRERLNLLLVAVLVTLIQLTWFGVLVFVFFVAFGVLTITDATAAQWMGRPPDRLDGLSGLLPINRQLVQVSMMIAAFSGLNFAAIAGSDKQYRATFVDPALDEVRRGLEVRESYLRPDDHRRDA
ncbi:hypothetical protein [Naumannella cuiyingiana]|uniref:MFS family permease n=1 Tax=Naumannella cuiyingiana TaxID=1347891 RepID=A0A7Z0DAE1_9ACTN|nr:hypothetical protein [Naumannella cuiyingiana]NYI71858.1 MFS family permease [Naumannella cuiyingiana]